MERSKAIEVCEAALLTVFVLVVTFSVLSWATGCKTTHPYSVHLPVYEDTLWRAQAIQDLAYDYRCDDEFDFKASCAADTTQERLKKLKKVPDNVLEPLRARAAEINASWAGE